MPRRSVNELTKIGFDALGSEQLPSASEARLVRAFAAMLGNIEKARAPRAKAEPKLLPVSPQSVFQQIQANGFIICDPVDNRWFGRLGGLLKNIRVEQADLERLLRWFDAGGLKGWPQGKPGFTHLLVHLDKWLGQSREWEARGCQTLHGRSTIGSAVDSAPDMSAFNVPRLGD